MVNPAQLSLARSWVHKMQKGRERCGEKKPRQSFKRTTMTTERDEREGCYLERGAFFAGGKITGGCQMIKTQNGCGRISQVEGEQNLLPG